MKQQIPQYGFGGFLKDAFMTGIVKGIPVIGNLADNYKPETKLGKTMDKVLTPLNKIKNSIGAAALNSVTGGIGGSLINTLDMATDQEKPAASNEQIAPVYEDGGMTPEQPQYINIEKGELRINPKNLEIIEHYNDRRFSAHSKNPKEENPNNFVEATSGDFIVPTKYSNKYINFPELRASIIRQVQNNNLDKRDMYVKTPDAQFVKCGGMVKRHGEGDFVGPTTYDFIPPIFSQLAGPLNQVPNQLLNSANKINPTPADYQMPTNSSLQLPINSDYNVKGTQNNSENMFSVPRFAQQMKFPGEISFATDTRSILDRAIGVPEKNFFGKTKEQLANEKLNAEFAAEDRAKAALDPKLQELLKTLEDNSIAMKAERDKVFKEGQGKIDEANKLAKQDKAAYYGQMLGDAAYLHFSEKTPFENSDLKGTEAIDYLKGQPDVKLSALRAATDNTFNKMMESLGGSNQNQRAARINAITPALLAQMGDISQQEMQAELQKKGNIAAMMSDLGTLNTGIKNQNKERKEEYLGAKNTRRADVAQKAFQYPVVGVKQKKQELADLKKMEEQYKFLQFLTKAYPAAAGDLSSMFSFR